MSRGWTEKFQNRPPERKISAPLPPFVQFFPRRRVEWWSYLKDAKEERAMLWDGTRDLDDLIFPEEWEISQR